MQVRRRRKSTEVTTIILSAAGRSWDSAIPANEEPCHSFQSGQEDRKQQDLRVASAMRPPGCPRQA